MREKMSGHTSKMKILLGQVIGTKMKKTAKVRVERLVLDKYVMQYYPKRTTVFAHDAQEEAKEGDVVLVKQLPLPRSRNVKYLMDRIIYSEGNVTDPITGRKCDGSSYWVENTLSHGQDDETLSHGKEDDKGLSGKEPDASSGVDSLEMARQSKGTLV